MPRIICAAFQASAKILRAQKKALLPFGEINQPVREHTGASSAANAHRVRAVRPTGGGILGSQAEAKADLCALAEKMPARRTNPPAESLTQHKSDKELTTPLGYTRPVAASGRFSCRGRLAYTRSRLRGAEQSRLQHLAPLDGAKLKISPEMAAERAGGAGRSFSTRGGQAFFRTFAARLSIPDWRENGCCLCGFR